MRTIDADLFKSNVKAWAENIRDFRSDNKCFFTEENVLKAIDDQPTVDTEPIKHGKWVDTQPDYHDGYYRNAHQCSNCQDYYTTDYSEMNYCPNCGAKMKE